LKPAIAPAARPRAALLSAVRDRRRPIGLPAANRASGLVAPGVGRFARAVVFRFALGVFRCARAWVAPEPGWLACGEMPRERLPA